MLRRAPLLLCLILAAAAVAARAQEQPARQGAAEESGIKPLWMEGSRREKELVWYVAFSSDAAEGLALEFERAYPWIDVKVTTERNADMLRRWDADRTGPGPKPDVLTVRDDLPTRHALSRGQDRARLRLLRHIQLPCGWLAPEDPIYVYTYAARFTLAYNPKLLKKGELPGSWSELADPRWRGRLAMLEPANDVALPFFRSLARRAGAFWIQGLAANEPLLAPTRRKLRRLVATKPLVGLGVTEDELARDQLLKTEESLKGKALEGAPALLYLTAFNKPPPHPYSASLFLQWLFTPEAQAAAARLGGFSPITQASCGELQAAAGPEARPEEAKRLKQELSSIFHKK